MSITVDPLAVLASISSQITLAVAARATDRGVANWLPTGSIYTHTPVSPYPELSPKPFGILRAPALSTGHQESYTIGSADNTPNVFSLLYFEDAWASNVTRQTEEDRVYDTYGAIAQWFVDLAGGELCLPNTFDVTAKVALLTNDSGPFMLYGQQTWIGGLIQVLLIERYD